MTSSRRSFVKTAAALAAGAPFLHAATASAATDSIKGRIYKTLKIGMIGVKGTMTEKFKSAKDAGFQGVELNAPGFDIAEIKKAKEESGLVVDGSVCSDHWNVRHTDPDAAVRAKALETLKQALRDTHAVGGHTVLLVVGHGKDGAEADIWKRSVDNIAQAVPLAAELGVAIAIENVWNEFCYNHAGDATQSAEKFVKYVDEFRSPWVGMQFDIGNHWKYGDTGGWIRALDKRVIKLDIKGFSRKENKFKDITEDDIDWADIRQSLVDINFYGWCAAEVGGGDLARLQKVSADIDRALGLA